MPNCLSEGDTQSVVARLGQALRRLRRTVEHTLEKEREVDVRFQKWQAKWSKKHGQIVDNLASVESDLERLTQTSDDVPQLSIIRMPV